MNKHITSVEPVSLSYEQEYNITLFDKSKRLYHFFDFDQRSSDINMEFEHLHRFYEIHILIHPEAFHIIEGKRYHIKKHDIVLLPPKLLHKSEYLPGSPSKRLIINFTYHKSYLEKNPVIKHMLDIFDQHSRIYRFDTMQHNEIFEILNKIYSLSKQSHPTELKELLIQNYFVEFLFTLNHLKSYNLYSQNTTGDELKQKIYEITTYIHRNYHTELSLEVLSKTFFISTFYLSHQFKRITGYTLTTYIQMTRIRNAQYLLLNSTEKVTTIAELCGFTSTPQFNRVFLKVCGISPSSYRKNGILITDDGFFNID